MSHGSHIGRYRLIRKLGNGGTSIVYLGHDPVACDALAERLEASLQNLNGSLLPGVSPHTPHTVSERLLRRVQEISLSLSVPKAIHLSDTWPEFAVFGDVLRTAVKVLDAEAGRLLGDREAHEALREALSSRNERVRNALRIAQTMLG